MARSRFERVFHSAGRRDGGGQPVFSIGIVAMITTTGQDNKTDRTTDLQRTLDIVHQPGDVVEVRILGIPGRGRPYTAAGYFDDFAVAAESAIEYDDHANAAGIYFCLNQVNPALLARSPNQITPYPAATTTDHDVTLRRWLLIDVDPCRPAGIGSTDEELQAARTVAESVREWLASQYFSQPIEALSGNGCHLLYPISLPNDNISKSVVESILKVLDTQFSTAAVTIDRTVGNAARITKLYGTTVRKGHHVADRPHRRSRLLYVPDYLQPGMYRESDAVPAERLQAVADMWQAPTPAQPSRRTITMGGTPIFPTSSGNGRSRLDVPRYLQACNVDFRTKDIGNATAYLVRCPFDESHGSNGETAIFQSDTGLVTYECKHNSCQSRKWADYRAAVGTPDPDHYDPPLHTRQQTTGTAAGQQTTSTDDQQPAPLAIKTIGELTKAYPRLRPPVIHGLLRQGETLNVISSPKVGKSWLVADMALSIVTGRQWLDVYDVAPGRVLILDNELHAETLAYRVARVAEARGVDYVDYADTLHTVTLRGCLTDIIGLGPRLLDRVDAGTYRLIILDAMYRAVPAGTDENSNSAIAAVYNHIDSYALRLGVGFCCVHHTSKGDQSSKSVTDVGAGAGSQARATDTHLILRPHTEDGAVVLDAAARSWPPIDPVALRWEWPLWTPDTELDPAALRDERQAREETQERAKVEKKKQAILDTFMYFPDGATERDILKRVGRGVAFESAWQYLTTSGHLKECKMEKNNGHTYDAWTRVYRDDK